MSNPKSSRLQQVSRKAMLLSVQKRSYHLRSRQGISEPALNKHLESLGFRRIRVRMQSIVRCMRAPRWTNSKYCGLRRWRMSNPRSGTPTYKPPQSNPSFTDPRHRSSAGTWLFDHRRWLDPLDAHDCALLIQARPHCHRPPCFRRPCRRSSINGTADSARSSSVFFILCCLHQHAILSSG
jgi:hypothetical protein